MSALSRPGTLRRLGTLPIGRELAALCVLAIVAVAGAATSPYFLDFSSLSQMTSTFMADGIVSLAMTMLIAAGQIDLSVGSMLGLTAAVLGELASVHAGIGVLILATLAAGCLLGFVNGFVVAVLRIPSLIATLGTMSLYAGLSSAILGPNSLSDFPGLLTGMAYGRVPGTGIPQPLFVFLVCAVVFVALFHFTTFGRETLTIGINQNAASFSGIPVRRRVITLFVITGFMVGVAAIVDVGVLGAVRSDLGANDTLGIVTAAVLGGAYNVFGGDGRMVGTVISVLAITMLEWGMTLENYTGQDQVAAVGVVLVLALIVPQVVKRVGLLLRRTPQSQN